MSGRGPRCPLRENAVGSEAKAHQNLVMMTSVMKIISDAVTTVVVERPTLVPSSKP